MDNFIYDEEILLEEDYEEILDEDGVPVEIYADEPETTTKLWQTTAAETTAKTTEVQTTKQSVPVYTRTEYLAPETELTTITEVHSDEFTQTEELPLPTETELAVTAVAEVPEESETEGTETAVSSVPSETGVSETVTEVEHLYFIAVALQHFSRRAKHLAFRVGADIACVCLHKVRLYIETGFTRT